MAFGGTIMGIRKTSHSDGLNLLPDIEVIPHYDKMLGWLPDRVASFIARIGAESTLIGIDENTALISDGTWRVVGAGKVHILRGALEIA
jgi:cyanophycinase